MTKTIDFPNLGIHLANVGKNITIHGFTIAFYGMVIGFGMMMGILIACYIAKQTGQNQDTYVDLALYGIIFGVIGARIYYVAFSWDMYKDDLKSIFNTRQGGLAIYGGVIAAMIVMCIYAKVKKQKLILLMDTVAFGLPLGQAIGRWGNFFNREAFGEYTNSLFAMRIPVDAVRSGDITELMREHMETVDGISYIQVHPTFLYESVWCLGIVIFLLCYYKHKKFDGELFLIYLMLYGLERSIVEGLRTDSLYLPGLPIKVSQMLAMIIFVVSLSLIVYNRILVKKKGVSATEAEEMKPQN